MIDATQKEQLMSYAHLGALALGPIAMILVLFFMLGRGKKKAAPQAAPALEAPTPTPVAEPSKPAMPTVPGRPGKPGPTCSTPAAAAGTQ